ncbi:MULTISPECIES: ribonuclease J [Caldisericum]|uniref:Ribonuclease J n=1 Tax=Caldisericum exile TaxID=693075 RepID=A0A2J6WFJ3_9BACT|nr:MAG: ribonuclease J [Caldisericum exile]
MKNEFKIIPLGGIGEIGKNSTLLEYKGDLALIDFGFKFPPPDLFGVDFIIPDYNYVLKNKNKLKGVVLTHGHLDHIGGLRFLLEEAKPSVILGSDLTLGLVKENIPPKLKSTLNFEVVKPRQTVKVGNFEFTFLTVTHSIPGSFGVVVKTEEGRIFFTGDYKFDATPIDGRQMDIEKLEELSKSGIDVLFSDSTNADESGLTGSESIVGQSLYKIIEQAPGRVIVATFSTNIHRIQQVIDISERLGRKVAFDGRSIIESVKIASKLGYLKLKDNVEVELSDINALPKKMITIITTGTQGEPMSGLVRISNGEHNGIKITKGDIVIISADPIPGNERLVSEVVNKLFKLGAFVYYRKEDGIHVSGHCSQEDIRFMIDLVKPKYFVPVHGEYKHLVYAKKIGEEEGIPSQNIVLLENGLGVALADHKLRKLPRISTGEILVEGNMKFPVKNEVDLAHIGERKELATKGVLLIIVFLKKNREFARPIHIETRGFVLPRGQEGDIIREIKVEVERIVKTFAKKGDFGNISKEIERSVKSILKKTVKPPMVISSVLTEK